ncbi:MAG: hypothetical protein ACLT2Z_00875 [Eubacterium sp.]
MICYNCGNVLTNSDFCSHCGMDVSVYKRIVRLSNTYYNEGLTKAKTETYQVRLTHLEEVLS